MFGETYMNYKIAGVEALYPRINKTYKFDSSENRSVPCDALDDGAAYEMSFKMDEGQAKALMSAMASAYKEKRESKWPEKFPVPFAKMMKYGKVREKLVADMLQDKKIEVKSERDVWQRTGNIAIEYQSYGKPSGIQTTEADYWFHNLCIGEEVFCTLVFDINSLRKIIDNLDYKKSVSGGDHNASRMYLLNLQKLFSSDVIKTFKGG